MRYRTVLNEQDVLKQRETETGNYLHSLIFNLSSLDLNSPDASTKDLIDKQKEIFNFLFATLSKEAQLKVVFSVLSNYTPSLGLDKIEGLIGNFLYNDNGIEGAIYHPKRRIPLLTYLYELENSELFTWAKSKYKLDIHEEYNVVQTFKFKTETGEIQLKQDEYTSNLLDSIFNRFINSINAFEINEKEMKKLIEPLDLKTFKSLNASSFLKKKIGSINFLSKTRKNAYAFQKIEYFFSFLSDEKHPFIAHGIINNCHEGIFCKDNNEAFLRLLDKTKKDYSSALTDKQKFQIDELTNNKAVAKLMRATGESLSKLRRELSTQYELDTSTGTNLAPNLRTKLSDAVKSELDALVSKTYQELAKVQFTAISEFDFMTKISDYISSEINRSQYSSKKYETVFSISSEHNIHHKASLSSEFLESVALHLSTFCSKIPVSSKALKI